MSEASNAPVSEAARALRVIAYPAFSNRGNNPYNHLLYTAMRECGVEVVNYHAKHWLRSRFDVFHVHWPETSFNGSWLKGLSTTRTLLVAIDWMKRSGTRLVWTVHNLRAHNQKHPRSEAAFWRAFLPRVDGFISLTESGLSAARERFPELGERPGFVVPHHHYRGEYPDSVSRQAARDKLGVARDARVVLFFGRIIRYKNVAGLVRAVIELDSAAEQDIVLLVTGKCEDPEYEREVRQVAAADSRIRLVFEYVSREDAQYYFRAADLVALPFLEINNSGSAVLALSFDRPVLMPRRGACVDLQAAVGRDWVYDYQEFGPAALRAALDRAVDLGQGARVADLRVLDPSTVVRQTIDAYRAILAQPAAT